MLLLHILESILDLCRVVARGETKQLTGFKSSLPTISTLSFLLIFLESMKILEALKTTATMCMLSLADVSNDFVEKTRRPVLVAEQLSRRKFMHVGLSNH